MDAISKKYSGVLANDGVCLNITKGSLHAVIGENGAGKSTLLGILYGRTQADSGKIYINGEDVTHNLRTPADAISFGIGMVSQHYSLIPALSVLENCILGSEPTIAGGWIDSKKAASEIELLANKLDIADINLKNVSGSLSIAAQQKVEILKALYRGARILLLDEPTATLAPSESEALFRLLHQLVLMGTTVVYITHKLQEVMAYSETVTVLRSGKSVAELKTALTTKEELLGLMMGQGALNSVRNQTFHDEPVSANLHERSSLTAPKMLLQVANISTFKDRKSYAVQDVSLNIEEGEIVGVAGVDGSGQRELAETLVGVRAASEGTILLGEYDITTSSIHDRRVRGIAYIPEDRNRAGLIPSLSVADNYLLGTQRDSKWGGGRFLNSNMILNSAELMIASCDIRTGDMGARSELETLSGGNQQKLLAARSLKDNPRLLIACQPTRGLDIAAATFVYRKLRESVSAGMSVLLFSSDIDELMEVSDRIVVMFNRRIAGEVARENFTLESIGALMTGAAHEPPKEADS